MNSQLLSEAKIDSSKKKLKILNNCSQRKVLKSTQQGHNICKLEKLFNKISKYLKERPLI